MPVIIESLVLILAGVAIALALIQFIMRGSSGRQTDVPSVRIVRSARTPEGREETRLVINDQSILLASNDGVRLADYANEMEQLEALADRLAGALGVTVEFARLPTRRPGEEPQLLVRDLPHDEPSAAPDDLPARRSGPGRREDQGER